MNETFNLKRFFQYAKIRFFSQKLFYLSPLFLVGITIFIIISDIIFDGSSGITQEIFLGVCCTAPFLGALVFYSSRAYSDFHNRSKGFILSTLPASTFEKFLFGFFQSTIIFGILYSTSFFISLFIVVGYNSLIPTGHKEIYNALLSFENVNAFNDAPIPSPLNFKVFANLVLVFGTLYALGSVVFKRIGFIYTSLILVGLMWMVTNILGLIFCGNAWGCPDALNYIFAPILTIDSSKGSSFIFALAAFYISSILIWFAVFHRLKEKEY
jgi:hypothetical protein